MNRLRLRGSDAASVRLGLSVMLVAVNLRLAAACVGPLLNRVQAENGLSTGWAGALATLPVLCFGVVALAAPPLTRRFGVHAAVALAMCVLTAGQLIRLIPGVGLLFLGTALAGSAIAIGNVLLPVLTRRDFAVRAGIAMSLFSACLIGFAALAAGVTVPIADSLGGGWRPGFGVWAAPAAIAALVWLPRLVTRHSASGDPPAAAGAPPVDAVRRLLRSPLAWQVTLFFAVQSGGFYATLSWLPSIFRAHGASEAHAGVLLSITLIVGIFTALTIPGIAGRLRDQRGIVVATCLLSLLGWVGILVAPMSAPYLWVVLLGLGQNGSFPLVLMLIVLRGGTVRSTQELSTMAQSVGYILAAVAPLVIGALHGLTHSWTPELIVLIAFLFPQLLLGLAASRDRQLATPGAHGVAEPAPSGGP